MELRGCPICGEEYTNVKEISGRYWAWHWCTDMRAIAWDNALCFDITHIIVAESPFK